MIIFLFCETVALFPMIVIPWKFDTEYMLYILEIN